MVQIRLDILKDVREEGEYTNDRCDADYNYMPPVPPEEIIFFRAHNTPLEKRLFTAYFIIYYTTQKAAVCQPNRKKPIAEKEMVLHKKGQIAVFAIRTGFFGCFERFNVNQQSFIDVITNKEQMQIIKFGNEFKRK